MFGNRTAVGTTPGKRVVLDVLAAGIRGAHPERVVDATVSCAGSTLSIQDTVYDIDRYDRVVVLGGGKAAGVVAAELEACLGECLDAGVVVTDNPVGTTVVEEVVGDHPLPSADGVAGSERVLDCAEQADESTLIVTILTGGGSALLAAPVSPISLDDLRATTATLIESGAEIHAINTVRKHLSRLKGGRLAARAHPATVVGIIVSDVVGNDPTTIASGPLTPDPTTFDDAWTVLTDIDATVPDRVTEYVRTGRSGGHPDTPDPGAEWVTSTATHVIADNDTAIDAACTEATAQGYDIFRLGADIRGDAQRVGTDHASLAHDALRHGDPIDPPAVILSGGETTVQVEDGGTGGPNQECALRAALDIHDWVEVDETVVVACIDTDGIDGNSRVAGALLTDSQIQDSATVCAALEAHDVTPLLDSMNATLATGFTGTNVNDLRAILVDTGQ